MEKQPNSLRASTPLVSELSTPKGATSNQVRGPEETTSYSYASINSPKGSNKISPTAIGSFATKQLRQAGFLGIAEKIILESKLDEGELRSIFSAPLPILLKLIELKNLSGPKVTTGGLDSKNSANDSIENSHRSVDPGKGLLLRAAIHTSLAATLEEKGERETVTTTVEQLLERAQGWPEQTPLFLSLDRWKGAFPTEKLFDTLSELLAKVNKDRTFSVIGPSTGELKGLMNAVNGPQDPFAGVSDTQILELLYNAGVRTIEGGSNIALHEAAIRSGFQVAIAQELKVGDLSTQISTCTPLGPTRSNLTPTSGAGVSGAKGLEIKETAGGKTGYQQFLANLWAIEARLMGSKKCKVWFPIIPAMLDTNSTFRAPLGAEVLRAIALARIILRDIPFIRAPIALCGINAAHVALSFGANDLGYTAFDSQTANELGLCPHEHAFKIVSRHLAEQGAKKQGFVRVIFEDQLGI